MVKTAYFFNRAKWNYLLLLTERVVLMKQGWGENDFPFPTLTPPPSTCTLATNFLCDIIEKEMTHDGTYEGCIR